MVGCSTASRRWPPVSKLINGSSVDHRRDARDRERRSLRHGVVIGGEALRFNCVVGREITRPPEGDVMTTSVRAADTGTLSSVMLP
jgi:hypothetical protein